MKKYDTVIFDMDGTLIDTLEDMTDCLNHSLALYNYPKRTVFEVRSFVGNGIANLVELAIPEGRANINFQKFITDFQNHYSKNMNNKTHPYDGVIKLLDELSKRGYKIAIASNKYDAALKELCKLYFGDYIKVAIGESISVSKKPAPDIINKALSDLESTIDKAVFVGDSEVDVETSKNAGIDFIAVTWGFRDKEILKSHGANRFIDKPEELFDII